MAYLEVKGRAEPKILWLKRKLKKTWKKVLTKGRRGGIMSKLSARSKRRRRKSGSQRKKILKKVEKSTWQKLERVLKFETVARQQLSETQSFPKRVRKKNLKKFEKSTWQRKRDVVRWKPAADERCAPCKLNNVTNTKHQKDWLFQRVSKEACFGQRQLFLWS